MTDTAPQPEHDPSTATGALQALGMPAPDATGAIRVRNRSNGATPEGPPIVIDGQLADGTEWSVQLRTVGAIPIGVETDAGTCITVRDGELYYRRDPVLRVLGALIHPDDRGRWHDLLNDADKMVHLATLGDLLMALVANLTDRPTGPPPT